MSVDAYELAYREAVRALEHQRAAVSELRSRASALVAIASITMSVLGPAVFASAPFGWLAIACFVLLGACVIAVVWPSAEWRSSADHRKLLTEGAGTSADEMVSGARVALRLVAQLAEDRQVNAALLARVSRAFRAATCLLVVHLISAVAAASTTT